MKIRADCRSVMTPSRMGRTVMSPTGVRPTSSRASCPTRTGGPEWPLTRTAMTDGSLSTIRLPGRQTTVLAVPRSIPKRDENISQRPRFRLLLLLAVASLAAHDLIIPLSRPAGKTPVEAARVTTPMSDGLRERDQLEVDGRGARPPRSARVGADVPHLARGGRGRRAPRRPPAERPQSGRSAPPSWPRPPASAGLDHPGLLVPQPAWEDGGSVWVVRPHDPGVSLRRLGGRGPSRAAPSRAIGGTSSRARPPCTRRCHPRRTPPGEHPGGAGRSGADRRRGARRHAAAVVAGRAAAGEAPAVAGVRDDIEAVAAALRIAMTPPHRRGQPASGTHRRSEALEALDARPRRSQPGLRRGDLGGRRPHRSPPSPASPTPGSGARSAPWSARCARCDRWRPRPWRPPRPRSAVRDRSDSRSPPPPRPSRQPSRKPPSRRGGRMSRRRPTSRRGARRRGGGQPPAGGWCSGSPPWWRLPWSPGSP